MIIDQNNLRIIRQHFPDGAVVQTSGVFDLVHVDHIAYLKKARSFGEVLVVLIPSDEFVRKSKGPSRPVIPQAEKAEVVNELESVDFVIPTSPRRSTQNMPVGLSIAKTIRANVIVDISDSYWAEDIKSLKEADCRLVILPEGKHRSTSDIINKITEVTSSSGSDKHRRISG